MKLDAMYGKSSVGYDRKISEPSRLEVKRNIESYNTANHGMKQEGREPYPIPAHALRASSQNRSSEN